MNLKALVRDIPDFPKKGILFKDITPLLADPAGLKEASDALARPFLGRKITRVAAVESRGFLLGTPVALALGAGLVLVRKPRKLPWKTVRQSYQLEYGEDVLEMHEDAVGRADRVLVVDDVLATGGTAEATGKLLASRGAEVVGFSFLIELAFLKGRTRLQGQEVASVITY